MNAKQIVITIIDEDVPKEYIGKLDKKLSQKILGILDNAGISAEYHNHITNFSTIMHVDGPAMWPVSRDRDG